MEPFKTVEELVFWLDKNEEHPKWRDVCDEFSILKAYQCQMHDHKWSENVMHIITDYTEDNGPKFRDAFNEYLMSIMPKDHMLEIMKDATNFNSLRDLMLSLKDKINPYLAKAFVPFLKDHEPSFYHHIMLLKTKGEIDFNEEEDWFRCPDDMEVMAKVNEQLDLCNQLLDL